MTDLFIMSRTMKVNYYGLLKGKETEKSIKEKKSKSQKMSTDNVFKLLNFSYVLRTNCCLKF